MTGGLTSRWSRVVAGSGIVRAFARLAAAFRVAGQESALAAVIYGDLRLAERGGRVQAAVRHLAARWSSGPGVALRRCFDHSALVVSLDRYWDAIVAGRIATSFSRSLTGRLISWYFTETPTATAQGVTSAATVAATAAPEATDSSAVRPRGSVALRLLELLTIAGVGVVVWLLPVLPALLLTLVCIAVLALVVLRWLLGGQSFSRAMVAPALAFVAFGALATLTSVAPLGSLRDLAILIGSAGIFLALAGLGNRRVWFVLISSLVAAATLVAAYGLVQYLTGGAAANKSWFDATLNPELTSRVSSTFGNPNILAEYLVLVLPLGVALFWSERNRLKQMLYLAMCCLMGLVLILTMSRGGWLGIAMAAVIFASLADRRLLLMIPIVGILGYFAAPSVIMTRIGTITNLADQSNAYRLGIWLATIAMIRDFWVTGIGLGYRAFMLVYEGYKLNGRVAWHSHNLYLQQFVELGIAGMILFIWLIVRTLAHAIATAGLRVDRRLQTVAIGCAAGLGGVLFHGLVEDILYLPTIIITFWMLIGLAAATGRIAAGGAKQGAPLPR